MDKMEIKVIVGGIVINDARRVLLVRNISKKKGIIPWVGKWTIPGGKVNFGESLTSAVIREVSEETNILCKVVRHLCTFDSIVELEGEKKHYVLVDYLLSPTSGRPQASLDAKEASWFALDSLSDLEIFDDALVPIREACSLIGVSLDI